MKPKVTTSTGRRMTCHRKKKVSGVSSSPPRYSPFKSKPKKLPYDDISFKDMSIHAPPEAYGGLVEIYPSRCPIVTAYALRPYVEGKTFCDLGCGAGDLAWVIGEWAITSIGIEKSRERAALWDSRESKRENVQLIQADYFESEIPVADVYFYWGLPEFLPRVVELLLKIAPGSLLIGGARDSFLIFERSCKIEGITPKRTKRGFLLEHVEHHGGYVLRMPLEEKVAVGEPSVDQHDWMKEDLWCLCVIPLSVSGE